MLPTVEGTVELRSGGEAGDEAQGRRAVGCPRQPPAQRAGGRHAQEPKASSRGWGPEHRARVWQEWVKCSWKDRRSV